jgi:hypothetical protein
MLETKRLFIAGLLLAWLAPLGCYDFDKAFDDCVAAGECKPDGCAPERVDLPDDFFHDDNCDGMDGDPRAALFVDPIAGKDSNAGTPEAPFQTLAHALRRAAAEGKALYLAQGNYDEALTLDKPVSLHGGYSGVDGGWARGKDYTPHIGGGSIGLTVSGLGEDAGVLLERLHIASVQAPDAGAPSIGLRVMNSGGVRLRYVRVVAGAGAPGMPGSSPQTTALGGADGGAGQSTQENTAPARADGGSPGISGCGDGGTGGFGGTQFVQPAQGEAAVGSADGGVGGQNQIITCSAGEVCRCDGQPGANGQDGFAGKAGKDGSPGNGLGQLKEGTWVPEPGTPGESGSPGGGGGGGGGGGYCLVNSEAGSEGGGGGGGGAGGCPGTGASGGGGGGASIAILLLNGHLSLESTHLETVGGGQGGAGGTGRPGGPGGLGGAGGVAYTKTKVGSPTNISVGGTGGQGGNGGPGGRGGHGGNGGGGPSVGVWCDSASSLTQKGSTIKLGPAGQPGTGPGLKDTTLLQAEYHQCPLVP